MRKQFWLLSIMMILALSVFTVVISCDDDDDDDDEDDNDDDDDTGDDDTGDDDDDDDTAGLPDCEPFAESDRWITWGDLLHMTSEFMDEKDEDNVVNGVVSWDGDTFTITKGTYEISGVWNRTESTAPITEGQNVKVHYSSSAGDDGCCDTEGLWIWDESWVLLLYYNWNENMYPVDLGEGFEFDSASEWEVVCLYAPGEQPDSGSLDWDWVGGLSLTGYYNTSEFAVDAPGGFSVADDGLFEVNWPVAYRGYLLDDDEEWLGHNSVMELVVAVD